ncbi:MAG: amidohydrolase [bacterium]|nr:amidohydrolase [bacterium]MDE0352434.1 amidohydrolase [bacterium]
MSDRIIIENAAIVTMNEEDDVIFDGSMVIEGNRIVAVGGSEAVSGYDRAGAKVIDAGGKAALPGFVDLHYHTAIGKGYCDHLDLWEILQAFWYPMIRALNPEEAYWAAMASYSESLKAGVTTANDMFRQLPALARAAVDSGIRVVLSNDIADPEHDLDLIEDNESAYHECHGMGDGRVEVYVGIEWLPLASEQLLVDCRALADQLGTGIHIHLNESLGEVEISKQAFGGRRPTEVAYDTGILGPDCVAAHCVHLSDREIGLMSETGTHISHNPTSNAKLGNGIARLPEILEAGINVGLGHDSAEGTNSCDLFQVMKWASLVHRAERKDATILQAPTILRMATRNGARALGHETGELSVGKVADVILVNLQNHHFTPFVPGNKIHLMSHLVYSAESAAVDTTIVDGTIVMEGREFVAFDEEEVLAKATESFFTCTDRMEVPEEYAGLLDR